jgi:lipoprotein NlpD
MNSQSPNNFPLFFVRFFSVAFKVFNILIACLTLMSCIFSQNTAPTSDLSRTNLTNVAKASHHIVKRGETLFAIAWQYGVDYRRLAAANDINSGFLIYPGQTLSLSVSNIKITHQTRALKSKKKTVTPSKLSRSTSSAASSLSNNVPRKAVKKTPRRTVPSARAEKKASPSRTVTTSNPISQKLRWTWPARGKVITNFSSTNAGNKGIDLSGKKGDSVVAAASGTIVYAGSGLRGYGKLIIIKHNETYLSAYAHNDRIRVKEGQKVKVGQRIADIGSSGSRTSLTKLHFEIRRNGQSVNPVKYLPKKNSKLSLTLTDINEVGDKQIRIAFNITEQRC